MSNTTEPAPQTIINYALLSQYADNITEVHILYAVLSLVTLLALCGWGFIFLLCCNLRIINTPSSASSNSAAALRPSDVEKRSFSPEARTLLRTHK